MYANRRHYANDPDSPDKPSPIPVKRIVPLDPSTEIKNGQLKDLIRLIVLEVLRDELMITPNLCDNCRGKLPVNRKKKKIKPKDDLQPTEL